MTGVFDQIKLLFEQQLYTNVVSLVSINPGSRTVKTVVDHVSKDTPAITYIILLAI
jgi:hypothetical protein